jgi:serine/threonine protein phosphatase 1
MQEPLDENRRIFAIGDIHGCINSLHDLILRLDIRPDDQFVFLGDYIDRGNQSQAVIDYLMMMDRHYSCHFIMGNHEHMFLDYLRTGDPLSWLYNGGKATLQSYRSNDGTDLPEEHVDFFRKCRYYLESETYFFAHGGLDPDLSIGDNFKYYKPSDFCWQRAHMQSTYLETGGYPWEKTLVCAHTPVPKPIVLERLIAIDTGCVYKSNPLFGWLTAVCLPSRELVQISNND